MTLMKLVVILASLFALLNIASGSIPSAPINVTIDNIGSRSINISWTRPAEDGNNSQLAYAVFYKVKGSSVLQLVELEIVTKAKLLVKPYREYEIFVMAKNKDGYGPPSVIKSILTAEEEPETCPTMGYIEPTDDDLDVIWYPIPKEDQNGKITHYVIFYKSKSMPEFKNVTTVNITNHDPNGILHKLKNMSYAESYGFKVAAVNSKGMCKGWQSMNLYHKYASATTVSPCAAATTASPSTVPTPSTPTPPLPTTTDDLSTTPLLKTTTSEPKEPSIPISTNQPTEFPSPADKLARTSESNWLVYVLIAMAVIVAIMGVTIFLLIWQLYKNHRFYRLRQEQYRMSNATPNVGIDNKAQDNAV